MGVGEIRKENRRVKKGSKIKMKCFLKNKQKV